MEKNSSPFRSRRNASAPPVGMLLTHLRRSMAPATGLMGFSCVFAGCISAMVQGHFSWVTTLLCLLFALGVQMTTNICGRYQGLQQRFSSRHDDADTVYRTSLLNTFKEGAWAVGCVTGLIGLAIMELAGWWSVGLAAIIVVLVWIDVAPPMMLLRTPWGILVTFLIFGPLCGVGTALVQTDTTVQTLADFDLPGSMMLACAAGLIAVNVHLSYYYSTFADDVRDRRQTFTVKYGRKTAQLMFLSNALVAYALLWWGLSWMGVPYYHCMMILSTIWLFWELWLCWSYGHTGLKESLWLARANLYGMAILWTGLFLLVALLG